MLVTVRSGTVRIWSRNAIEWTQRLPEIVAAVEALKLQSAQLDGELIALSKGRDDFNALQGRLSAENRVPAVLMLFDMPHLNGRSLRALPLVERKRLLAALLKKKGRSALRYSEHQIGDGEAAFAQAIRDGREGIVSKRVDSPYVGSRNGDWVKVKGRPSGEFAVIGFTEPKGSRAGIGALLLARRDKKKLSYAGRVGTGFSDAHLLSLRKTLDSLVVPGTEADLSALPASERSQAHWVRPRLVVEVYHQGIGGQGLLRQPAFKAIREDKGIMDIEHRAKPGKAKKSGTGKSAASKSPASALEGFRITHAERIVFPEQELTKGDVAVYYAQVAERMLPELANRPLSLLRCPDGIAKECFFQKHITQHIGKHVKRVRIGEKTGTGIYFCVEDALGLLELVQMNALEFHPWGTHADDIEHCDRMVFDLDPDPKLAWKHVVAAARDVKAQLAVSGLESFTRTTGGKGLHVVVPLKPAAPWDAVRNFSGAFAKAMSERSPETYVASAGEKNRRGKIFIDWLRNARGATSVASYSLRARSGGGVAMPVTWSGLSRVTSGDMYTIGRVLRQKAGDPWAGIERIKQKLPKI